MFRLCRGWVVAAIVVLSRAAPVAGEAVEVFADARFNAIFGGYYSNAVFFSFPGDARCVVVASGTATCGLDRPFGGVVLGHRLGSSTHEYVAIPVGVPVEVATVSGDTSAELFFVDESATDNAGSMDVSFVPDVGAPFTLTVDARLHCVPVERAATRVVPRAVLNVQATGEAYWAGPSFRYTSVVVMYDGPDGTRHFTALPMNGTVHALAPFLGGRVWLFFADLSGIWGDNGGGAAVTFTLEMPVAVDAVPWSAVKQHYRPGDDTRRDRKK